MSYNLPIGVPTCKALLPSSSSHTGLAAEILVLHLLLIDVSGKWLALTNTGVFKVCASSQESHGILNSIPRAAAMYITRNKFMHISSSTDTTCYCLLNHRIHRCLTNGNIKMRNQAGMASDKSLHQRFIKSVNRSATIPNDRR